jgi:hypothetical protein
MYQIKRVVWYPLPYILREKYYRVITSIAKEIELAQQYLGSGLLGRGMLVTVTNQNEKVQ